MKVGFCSNCKTELSVDNSQPAVFKSGRGYCRNCTNEKARVRYKIDSSKKKKAARDWAAKNPAKVSEYRKRYKHPEGSWRRWMYGITKDEYDAKILEQDGCCAICGKKMSRPCQDHNHKTGKNRDLLCVDCNHLLGQAHENTEILASAIRYLQKHEGGSLI